MHKKYKQVRRRGLCRKPRGAMHDLSARLKDGVKLGAILEDFPGAFEARWHHESGTGTEFPAIALPVFEHDAATSEAAELRLGVTDAPLAGGARPAAGEELLGGIGEVIGDGLPRVAGEQPIGGGRRGLTFQRGREIDDLRSGTVFMDGSMARTHARQAGGTTAWDRAARTPPSERLSCWRAKCPTRSGSRRSARRPGHPRPLRCWRSARPWPR